MKKLFQIKSVPHGHDRIREFVQDQMIAIGWPGIGDLTNVGKEEIRIRLEKKYSYKGQRLGTYLGVVNAFVNTMDVGDVVMFTRGEYVYIGEVGEYRYVAQYDNDQFGMCHQRPFMLKKVLYRRDLNAEVQELLKNRGTVTQFKHPIEVAELDKIFAKEGVRPTDAQTSTADPIDTETTQRAVEVLKQALESDDETLRVKAAYALLRYSRR